MSPRAGVLATGLLVPLPASARDLAGDIVRDIEGPLVSLVAAVCLLVGILLVLRAGFRLVHRAADRFGPGLHGTALQALAGVVLVNLADWLEAGSATLFGSRRDGSFGLAGAPGADGLIDALVVILFVVGLVAVARGVALLPVAADGRATMSGAACHIVGGLLACNFPSLAALVEAATGLELLEFG